MAHRHRFEGGSNLRHRGDTEAGHGIATQGGKRLAVRLAVAACSPRRARQVRQEAWTK